MAALLCGACAQYAQTPLIVRQCTRVRSPHSKVPVPAFSQVRDDETSVGAHRGENSISRKRKNFTSFFERRHRVLVGIRGL